MGTAYQNIEDITAKKLALLFEEYGFVYTQLGKFEDYNLYMDNRSFLEAEHIITFMGIDSRILALKPDITLSIAQNIPNETLVTFEKIYYIDEVYRLAKEAMEYKVVRQIGVELMGDTDSYSNIEIVNLAVNALSIISPHYMLDISHGGFLSALLDDYSLRESTKDRLMDAIYQKSPHNISSILEGESAPQEFIQKVIALASIEGSFTKTLTKLRPLVSNTRMEAAYGELTALSPIIAMNGAEQNVNLDFSASSNLDYYNGLVFSGYIKGIANKILSGGRYDYLMEKLGKNNGALGFAVYLSELTALEKNRNITFDILIYYDENCDSNLLLQQVKAFVTTGQKVRCEPLSALGAPLPFQYKEMHLFCGNILRKEGEN